MLAEAAQALRNFLDLYDLSPSLNYNLAQLDNSMERWPEALRYGLRGIELQKNPRVAHDLVGNVLFKIRALEDSAVFYRRALAYHNLGCAHRALKEDVEVERN